MRRTSAGFLALALLGTPVLGIHSSSAVTTTCFGRPATIVSDAGELVGTERDVIVSGRGFCSISGLDGSDRIATQATSTRSGADVATATSTPGPGRTTWTVATGSP